MTAFEVWSLILASVTLVAWGVYVGYTIRTFVQIKRQTDLQSESFLQIKKQTDLQSQALLSVGASIGPMSSAPARPLAAAIQECHGKWKLMLKAQAPLAATRQDQLIVLSLKNRGRSDIVEWKIAVSLKVDPGQHLSSQFQIQGNHINWEVSSTGSTDIIDAQGDKVDVLIAAAGPFPQAQFSWTIKYTDAQLKEYTHFVGDHEFTDTNVFALAAPPPAPIP